MSIPKRARRLVFNEQVWHWMHAKHAYVTIIWSPKEKKYQIPNWKITGLEKAPYEYSDLSGEDRYPKPGDVRKYIEEQIIAEAPGFTKDESAILGKLYVYREPNHSQAPVASIEKIEPGGIKTVEKFYNHLSEQKPVFLLQHWIDKEKRIGFYKLLVESYMVTVKIGWPRTWSGSFVEADPERTP